MSESCPKLSRIYFTAARIWSEAFSSRVWRWGKLILRASLRGLLLLDFRKTRRLSKTIWDYMVWHRLISWFSSATWKKCSVYLSDSERLLTIRLSHAVLEKKLTQSRNARDISDQADSSQLFLPSTDKHLMKPPQQQKSRWVKPSAGQEMMFTAQTVLQNHAYNCDFVLQITSLLLEPERLLSALKIFCSRHEVLRSIYHDSTSSLPSEENFSPQICHQKINPSNEPSPVCRVDYLQPPWKIRNLETILVSILSDCKRKFDLGVDSLVRMTLYELSKSMEYWVIHFTIHHIAIDEWAFKSFVGNCTRYTTL